MWNWIDIVVVVIIGYNLLSGLMKGFVKSAVQLFGFIASAIIAKIFYGTLSAYLVNNVVFVAELRAKINSYLQSVISTQAEGITNSAGAIDPTQLDQLNLPSAITNNIEGMINNANGSIQNISDMMANTIVNVVSFLAILVVCLIIFTIVGIVLDSIMKLPVLKSLNRALGVALGAVVGCLVVYAIMMVFTLLYPFELGMPVIEAIQTSSIAKFFYENNILFHLVGMVI